MPQMPPDLARPYTSLISKEGDWLLLVRRAGTLRELASMSELPEEEWPDEVLSQVRAARPAAGEPPSQRLARWRAAFARELADLQRAVTAAARAGGSSSVSDIDLRSALYLASRLLSTLYDVPIRELAV